MGEKHTLSLTCHTMDHVKLMSLNFVSTLSQAHLKEQCQNITTLQNLSTHNLICFCCIEGPTRIGHECNNIQVINNMLTLGLVVGPWQQHE